MTRNLFKVITAIGVMAMFLITLAERDMLYILLDSLFMFALIIWHITLYTDMWEEE